MKKLNDRIIRALVKRLKTVCRHYHDDGDGCMYCPASYEPDPCPRDKAEAIEEWWRGRSCRSIKALADVNAKNM